MVFTVKENVKVMGAIRQVVPIAIGVLVFSGCLPDTPSVPSSDTIAPVLSEISPVVTPSRTYSPSYTFNSTEAGEITYGGGCLAETMSAISGDNVISFSSLDNGTYSGCTIVVTDAAGNISSELGVSEFTIEWITRPINDTGITTCGDYAFSEGELTGSGTSNNDVDCVVAAVSASGKSEDEIDLKLDDGVDTDNDIVRAGQDAAYGRDADLALNSDADGHAGFSFTKLDQDGTALDASSSSWHCVKDNVTGLIWEVKQHKGNGAGEGLHDADDRYSWYSSDTTNNGGGYGSVGIDFCTGHVDGSPETYCNTQAYVARVNAAELCGFSNWRLPNDEELAQILLRDRINPAIDIAYFPNTIAGNYWSSSNYAHASSFAWVVEFNRGHESKELKDYGYHVRLVRDGL